jgi:PAS domain S-box-containing protein
LHPAAKACPSALATVNEQLQREIVERRLVEEELRRSHAALEAVVNASPLAIFAYDRDGKVILWNPAAEQMFGWTKEEVLGQLPPHVPDEEWPSFRAMLSEELSGKIFRDVEKRRRTKAGELLDLALWTAPLVVHDEILGVMHVLSDITARKTLEVERRRMSEELEQRVADRTSALAKSNRQLSERNAENELFLYSVSHDLRSPLVNLQGFSQELRQSCLQIHALLMDERVPEDIREKGLGILGGDVSEAIHYIQTAVTHLSDILAALLRLSRAGRAKYDWQLLDMNELAAEACARFEAEAQALKASIRIGNLPECAGDRAAVLEVFSHLLSNALRYSRADAPPQIEIGALPHEEDKFTPGSESRYNAYYVCDNGLGIPAELHGKVFQAFQRLHPKAAKGEGMGLALSKRIVQRHGGRLWFESCVGSGSTFYVELPARVETATSECE